MLGEILGESSAMAAVRERIERLLSHRPGARQLPPILIEGETGSGKGLVARAIHNASPRAGGPFVDINCAALPETLVEAELFGFERGAFTDARQPKPGLFQAAHGGVIFLDEIGLVPDAAQRKLLKVIEDRVVRRLGSTKNEAVDTWIIAATNEDLESLVRERRFRPDLYHRLSVVRLRLPPLRERGRDVLLLAEHFLARACAEYRLPPKRLGADARASILGYRWPGNVRELGNVIERAALLANRDEITAAELELPDDAPGERGPNWLHEAVADVERQHLLKALEETGWNLSRAAAQLGVPRNTLRYRIDRLGLAPGSAPAPPARTRARAAPRERQQAAAAPATPVVPAEERQFERQSRLVTALQISLSPSDDATVQESSRIVDLAVDRLRAFGARLEQVGFDGCTGVFGLEPSEDAPRRAAYAAIAVRQSVERGDAGRATVRIALDAAPAALSRFGRVWELDPPARQALMAQVAAVLDAAGPGEVLVGEGAGQFVERHFEIARAAATATGRPVYRVTGTERSGYEVAGRITRFVGRIRELDTLQSLVNAAAQQRGAAIGIAGEPGVGKSRLLLELARTAASARLRRLEAACASYAASTPFAMARALLRQYLGVTSADEPTVIEARVAKAVASAGVGADAVAPLASLLDALADLHPFVVLPPQMRRDRIVEAASRLLLASTQAEPLLVIVEDLHWMDPESQAVLDAIVRDLTGRRLLVVATYRPEYQHAWSEARGYEELRLGPLSRPSATEMLEDLIGADPSLAAISRTLLERTEGNPFFLEESVRTLVDDGVLAGTRGAYRATGQPLGAATPPTVRALLAARIDRLPPGRRRVLQCAAVIGRRAPLALLSAVAEAPEAAVRDDIAQLRRAEFLTPSAIPDVDAVFTHALTQDVAYESLLGLDRRLLHGRVLGAMETSWRDSLAEHAEVLAEHALRGEVWDRAVDHLRAAGANAYARGALPDAIARYERALELVARLPASRETARRSIDVRLDLHAPLTTIGRTREIAELYPEAERLARELDDGVRLGQVLQRMSQMAWMGGRYALGADYAQQALAVADAANDVPTRVHAHYFLGLHRHALGDYRGALPCFEWLVEGPYAGEAARIISVTIPMQVPAWSWLAFSAATLGDIGRAEAAIAQAIAIAEASEFQQARVIARTLEAIVLALAGRPAACVPALRGAVELGERIGYVVWLNALYSTYGLLLARTGETTAALPYLERAVLMNEKTGVRTYQSQRYAWWAEGLLRAGRVDEARGRADTAIELARTLAERGVEAEARLVRGLVALAAGDPASARAMFADAAATSAALGACPLEAHCRLALARALDASGEHAQAQRERARGESLIAGSAIAIWWADLSRP